MIKENRIKKKVNHKVSKAGTVEEYIIHQQNIGSWKTEGLKVTMNGTNNADF